MVQEVWIFRSPFCVNVFASKKTGVFFLWEAYLLAKVIKKGKHVVVVVAVVAVVGSCRQYATMISQTASWRVVAVTGGFRWSKFPQNPKAQCNSLQLQTRQNQKDIKPNQTKSNVLNHISTTWNLIEIIGKLHVPPDLLLCYMAVQLHLQISILVVLPLFFRVSGWIFCRRHFLIQHIHDSWACVERVAIRVKSCRKDHWMFKISIHKYFQ